MTSQFDVAYCFIRYDPFTCRMPCGRTAEPAAGGSETRRLFHQQSTPHRDQDSRRCGSAMTSRTRVLLNDATELHHLVH